MTVAQSIWKRVCQFPCNSPENRHGYPCRLSRSFLAVVEFDAATSSDKLDEPVDLGRPSRTAHLTMYAQ